MPVVRCARPLERESSTPLWRCAGGTTSDRLDRGAQGEVADLSIDSAGDEGFEIDEGCVRDKTSQLSDGDVEAIVEAGIDGDADISDEADATAEATRRSTRAACAMRSGDAETPGENDDEIFSAAFACSSDG